MLKAIHMSKSKARRIEVGAKVRSGFVWLDCEAPKKEELRKISKEYNIFLGELEDSLDEHERARVHKNKDYQLLIYKVPASRGETFHTNSVGIFLVGNTIITVHKRGLVDLSKVLESDSKHLESPVRFIHFLLETFTNVYFRALEDIGDSLEQLESRAIKVTTATHTKDIFKLKKALIFFHKSLIANREVLLSIKEGRAFNLNKKDILGFGDIYNDNLQLIDITGIYSEVLSIIMETDLSSASAALGDVMKKLTVVASFALVPTLIASIYGMNFRSELSPWNMPELNWFYGYPFSIGLMAFSVIIMYYFFKKRKWI